MTFLFGVNVAGFEFTPSFVQHYNTAIKPFIDAGAKVIRMPIKWEYVQPTLNGDLDPTYLAGITDQLQQVPPDVIIVLDLHNYMRRKIGSTNHVISQGNGEVKWHHLVDVWQKLAAAFDWSNIWFNLMNEPHSVVGHNCMYAQQMVINALRDAGYTQKILVSSNGYSGLHGVHASLPVMQDVITDPINNIALDLHQYFDSNYSGTSGWTGDIATMVNVFTNRTANLRTAGYQAFLGEFNAGNNPPDQHAMDMLTTVMQFMLDNQDVWIGATLWAGGLNWGGYRFLETDTSIRFTTLRDMAYPPALADVNISFPVSYRWRADTGVVTIGSAVTSWTDSVGSFALSQATGANQPEFVATEINGKPVIRFEGTKFMTGTLPAALAAIPDGNNTMLMVIKERGATQNQIIAGALNNSSAHRWGHRVLNGTKHGVNNTTFASNVNSNISVTGSRLDSLALIRSGADLTLNVSGVVTTDDVAVNPSFTTSNIFSLGRQGAAGFEEYAQVDIAEMVMLNRAISASELDDWHNYVHQRYGVTIV
jgi:endoglucanase